MPTRKPYIIPCISGDLYPPDSTDACTSHNSIHCLLLGNQSTPDGQTKKGLMNINLKKYANA